MTDAACVRCVVRRSAASPYVATVWPPTLVEVVGGEKVPERRQLSASLPGAR
jgi:hypothetical protein